jgi:hypothetical protein
MFHFDQHTSRIDIFELQHIAATLNALEWSYARGKPNWRHLLHSVGREGKPWKVP